MSGANVKLACRIASHLHRLPPFLHRAMSTFKTPTELRDASFESGSHQDTSAQTPYKKQATAPSFPTLIMATSCEAIVLWCFAAPKLKGNLPSAWRKAETNQPLP